VDLDGDGKDDWYCMGANGNFYGLISTGTTFQTGTVTTHGPFCTRVDLQVGDFNGDGRPDLHCGSNGHLAFGTGFAFLSQGNFPGACTPAKMFPADVDGDGVAELVCNNNGVTADDIRVRKWNGTTLTGPTTWKQSWCLDKVYPGDFNGDGKTDLLCQNGQVVAVAGSGGVIVDLMKEAQNGLGGRATVTYTPSTSFPEVHPPSASYPNANNPEVRPLVSEIESHDGRSTSPVAVSTFSYAGGRYDKTERQFLGYAYVRSTAPCLSEEETCPYTESKYSQEIVSAGSPTQVERKDGAGTALVKTSYLYTDTLLPIVPRRSFLNRVDNETFGPSGSKKTYSTYNYDIYGNKTRDFFSGDDTAGAPSDEAQTDSFFAHNTTDYIVNRVGRVDRRVPGGPALAAQELRYDGAPAYTVPPVKGNLTTARALKTGGSYVSRGLFYDNFGNITKTTDETGVEVTTGFDEAHHLYPESVESAGDEVLTSWDKACGVATQVTDPNGQTTGSQYDQFCRPTRTDNPASVGGFVIRSYEGVGNPEQQRTRVETAPATGSTGNDWSESYFDGFGRAHKTKKRGPSVSETIVSKRSYNARGGVATALQPHHENDPEPGATSHTYDPFDRLVETRHPDFKALSKSYDVWAVTTTDENGTQVTTRFDAYGRVTEEERTHQGQALVTQSIYDELGRLKELKDPLQNSWTWSFDPLGRMTSRSDPDAGGWSYTYDDAGRPLSQTDAKGQVTTFAYDPATGRPVSKTSGSATSLGGHFKTGHSGTGQNRPPRWAETG
jgi:YD repeat-containing protein